MRLEEFLSISEQSRKHFKAAFFSGALKQRIASMERLFADGAETAISNGNMDMAMVYREAYIAFMIFKETAAESK